MDNFDILPILILAMYTGRIYIYTQHNVYTREEDTKMGKNVKITVHPDYRIGEVDKRMYGAFLEPIRSWVYGGIWNPKHPTADDLGFRKDVLDLVREFDLPALRFPGGNWTSGWEWEESIGPLDQRKCQLDLAWRQYEPNLVGHDEYIEWAKRAKTEAIYTLNLGSADLKSAFHCVDYSLNRGGSYWSDLRRKYGHEEPYDIKTWCLGNEMDGSWQIASWEKDPRGYGMRAHEVAKIIKWIDPRCETVVCGSSSPYNTSYPQWDIDVLEQCYETVDHVSIHHYHSAPEGNIDVYLNASAAFEDFIKTTLASCDFMKTKRRSRKSLMISFDEYGCSFAPPSEPVYWYNEKRDHQYEFRKDVVEKPFVRYDPGDYQTHHPGRKSFPILEALALNSVAMTLLRHADRVKIGCMTGFLHNGIGIDGDHVWKTPTYYAYEQLNKYGRGVSLLPVVEGPVYHIEQVQLNSWHGVPSYDNVQAVESAAIHNEEKEELGVFFINRDQENDIPVDLDLRGFEGYKLVEHTQMYSDDLAAANTWDNQERVKPVPVASTRLENGRISTTAKKLSWNCIRLKK
jgi:alpha-N-arabinofuranosidase